MSPITTRHGAGAEPGTASSSSGWPPRRNSRTVNGPGCGRCGRPSCHTPAVSAPMSIPARSSRMTGCGLPTDLPIRTAGPDQGGLRPRQRLPPQREYQTSVAIGISVARTGSPCTSRLIVLIRGAICGSLWSLFLVRSLSTAGVHSLLMHSPVMGSLRCRAVGHTPIYDQLRGERINADVPTNDVDLHRDGSASRRRRGAAAPGAARLLGQSGPGTEDVAGHHRRVEAYPAAALTGDELGTVGVNGSFAGVVESGGRAGPRHARDGCRDGEQLPDSPAVSRSEPRHQLRHP